MQRDLTQQAVDGFTADGKGKSAFVYSSENDMAWTLGKWMCDNGMSSPGNVRMSRGYSLWASDMLFDVKDYMNIQRIK